MENITEDITKDFVEFTEIKNFPNSIMKKLFTPADRHLVKRVLEYGENVCRHLISEKYIKSCTNKFTKGYIYFEKGDVIGFVLWKEFKEQVYNHQKDREEIKTHIELLLICAIPNNIRLGSKIIRNIEDYAIDNKFRYISLEPLNREVMDFYAQHGYKIMSKLHSTLKMEKIIKPRKSMKIYQTRKNKLLKPAPAPTIEYFNYLLHPVLQNEDSYELLRKFYS